MIKDRVIDFRRVRAGDLIPHPDNWREHPKEQRAAYAAILDNVGFAGAVLTRLTDNGRLQIIDGHMRTEYDPDVELPCVVTDLTADEADQVLVSFDTLAMMARTNTDKLAALHQRIHTDHEGLRDVLNQMAADAGIDLGQGEPVEAPEAQIDRAGELQKEWQTELGQLWEIPSVTGQGVHRVLCGDSTSEIDVARLMGGVKADAVVTDPPYGVEYTGGRNQSNTPRNMLKGDNIDLYNVFLPVWIKHITIDAVFYIWFAGRNGLSIYSAVDRVGLNVRAMIVWNKVDAHYGNFMAQYLQKHEPCLYCVQDRTNWYGATNEISVWDIKQPNRNDYHLTQKPLECMMRPITNSSKKNDIITDPFLGSGTTLIAAEQTGRICYGMELEPAYVAVTLQRAQDMGLEPRLVNQDTRG